jgi:hypothetical protein
MPNGIAVGGRSITEANLSNGWSEFQCSPDTDQKYFFENQRETRRGIDSTARGSFGIRNTTKTIDAVAGDSGKQKEKVQTRT